MSTAQPDDPNRSGAATIVPGMRTRGAEPATIGPYLIAAVLSHGAAATVYRATDTRHDGRSVALKVFAPALSGDPGFQHRFRHDVARLGELRLPHVVPIHSYGVLDGRVYLDMRLLEGRHLAEAGRPVAGSPVARQLMETMQALRTAELGTPTAAEVLLSGLPGQEFVHVVGMGLGRSRQPGPVDDALLAALLAPPRRRRRFTLTAAVAVLALVAATLAWFTVGSAATPDAAAPTGRIAQAAVPGWSAVGTAAVDGRSLLVARTASDLGPIGTWDLATGAPVRSPFGPDATEFTTAVVAGEPVVVARSPDRLIHTVRLRDGIEPAAPWGLPEPPARLNGIPDIWGIAAAEVGGRTLVAAVQRSGPTVDYKERMGVRVAAVPSGEPVGPVVELRQPKLRTLALVAVGTTPVVVALGIDNTLQVFDATTGTPLAIDPGTPVTAAAVVDRADGPLLVLGGADNSVRTVDLRSGRPVGPIRTGHPGPVDRVLAADDGGRMVLVSISTVAGRSETRFWDPDREGPAGPVLVDHPTARGSITAGQRGDRAVLVSHVDDTATVWDLHELMKESAK